MYKIFALLPSLPYNCSLRGAAPRSNDTARALQQEAVTPAVFTLPPPLGRGGRAALGLTHSVLRGVAPLKVTCYNYTVYLLGGNAAMPTGIYKRHSLLERFLAKVTISSIDKCWNWQGAVASGYGYIGVGYKSIPAHRVSYELFVGPIPKGNEIDHTCINKLCVNPKHLEPVPPKENHKRWMHIVGAAEISRRNTYASQIAAILRTERARRNNARLNTSTSKI